MPTKQESGEGQYERSSPTALLVAYGRIFTDIPFSGEIFEESERIRAAQGEPSIPKEFQIPAIAPRFEARHKLINQLLRQSGITQALEIAAGLSPRGLEMTDNPSFVYVEVDLAQNTHLKRKIVDEITNKPTVGSRTNLYIEDGDALDLPSLQAASKHLDRSKPIAIITEGLLRYLTFNEKAVVARNIKTLLEQSRGVWIASDTTLRPNLEDENTVLQEHSDSRRQTTDIDPDLNLFKGNEEGQRFFEDIGFTIEDHSLMEIVEKLVSPKRLGKTDKEIEDLFNGKHVYVMKTYHSFEHTPITL